jgi:membrane peptidoglycan carboxypeptidase
MAKKMGVQRADGKEIDQVPSITLGTQEMSPLTMAEGYATFANRGVHCTPVAVKSITDARGKKLPVPKTSCKRAMSQRTADTVNSLLRGVVEDGTGQKAGLKGRDSAGKTGTTDQRYAAWFVGYTPNMSGAVWVGDPAHKTQMTDISIGGVYHDKVFGGEVPGPIWRDAMAGALDGKPAPRFNLVPIDDDKDKDKDKGRDKPKPPGDPWPDITLPPDFIGGGGNGGDSGTTTGTTDGGTSTGTTDGGNGNGGGRGGGTGGRFGGTSGF